MDNITTLADRAHILGKFWINERDNDVFDEYMEYNDLGLPLAYSLSEGIIETNALVEAHINDSFDMLLTVLKVEDTGFTDYNDILEAANNNLT
jgi:hypothetical protein